MVYKFKSSSYIKADAQVAGEICERLESQNNLTAKALVNESRPEDAPLHNAFEWDDSIAAESWREQQARHIIASLIVIPEKKEPVKAFFNIVRKEAEYKHIETILSNPNDTENLYKTVISELNAFKIKYETLERLDPVWMAVEKVEEDIYGR